jgi:tripartite-type tricarboxylate transporter receptor subunit TctC
MAAPARDLSGDMAQVVSNTMRAGNGTAGHLAGELFKMAADVNMIHVPYRGGGPAVTDLIGGQVQVLFIPLPAAIEQSGPASYARSQ